MTSINHNPKEEVVDTTDYQGGAQGTTNPRHIENFGRDLLQPDDAQSVVRDGGLEVQSEVLSLENRFFTRQEQEQQTAQEKRSYKEQLLSGQYEEFLDSSEGYRAHARAGMADTLQGVFDKIRESDLDPENVRKGSEYSITVCREAITAESDPDFERHKAIALVKELRAAGIDAEIEERFRGTQYSIQDSDNNWHNEHLQYRKFGHIGVTRDGLPPVMNGEPVQSLLSRYEPDRGEFISPLPPTYTQEGVADLVSMRFNDSVATIPGAKDLTNPPSSDIWQLRDGEIKVVVTRKSGEEELVEGVAEVESAQPQSATAHDSAIPLPSRQFKDNTDFADFVVATRDIDQQLDALEQFARKLGTYENVFESLVSQTNGKGGAPQYVDVAEYSLRTGIAKLKQEMDENLFHGREEVQRRVVALDEILEQRDAEKSYFSLSGWLRSAKESAFTAYAVAEAGVTQLNPFRSASGADS